MFQRSFVAILTFSFITIGLSSCSLFIEKVKFTKEELIHYNTYNKNDMLIFMNLQTRDKDTSVIIEKRIYYDWQLFAYSKYITPFAVLKYSNIKLPKRWNANNEQYLILLHKSKPYSDVVTQSVTYLSSNFLFNEGVILNNESLVLSGKVFPKVYELRYNEMDPLGYRRNDNSPEILYWSTGYGIIKYVSFKGEVWERINW